MTYTQEQVSRGRALVANLGRSKWTLGDLAVEIMPAEADMGGTERGVLENYAEEIGLSFGALQVYRKVSLAFPVAHGHQGRREDTDWGVHAELRSHPDRDAILYESATPWKVRTIRPRLGKASKDGTLVEPYGRSQRLIVAREVLQNAVDAAEVMSDLPTRVRANRAVVQAGAQDTEATARDFELANPQVSQQWAQTDREISKTGHGLNTRAYLSHARLDLIHASEEWAKADDSQGDLNRVTLTSIITLAQALLDSDGTTSLDNALADILAGGES